MFYKKVIACLVVLAVATLLVGPTASTTSQLDAALNEAQPLVKQANAQIESTFAQFMQDIARIEAKYGVDLDVTPPEITMTGASGSVEGGTTLVILNGGNGNGKPDDDSDSVFTIEPIHVKGSGNGIR